MIHFKRLILLASVCVAIALFSSSLSVIHAETLPTISHGSVGGNAQTGSQSVIVNLNITNPHDQIIVSVLIIAPPNDSLSLGTGLGVEFNGSATAFQSIANTNATQSNCWLFEPNYKCSYGLFQTISPVNGSAQIQVINWNEFISIEAFDIINGNLTFSAMSTGAGNGTNMQVISFAQTPLTINNVLIDDIVNNVTIGSGYQSLTNSCLSGLYCHMANGQFSNTQTDGITPMALTAIQPIWFSVSWSFGINHIIPTVTITLTLTSATDDVQTGINQLVTEIVLLVPSLLIMGAMLYTAYELGMRTVGRMGIIFELTLLGITAVGWIPIWMGSIIFIITAYIIIRGRNEPIGEQK